MVLQSYRDDKVDTVTTNSNLYMALIGPDFIPENPPCFKLKAPIERHYSEDSLHES